MIRGLYSTHDESLERREPKTGFPGSQHEASFWWPTCHMHFLCYLVGLESREHRALGKMNLLGRGNYG